MRAQCVPRERAGLFIHRSIEMEPDYEKIMDQYKTFESLCDKEPSLVQWSYYLEHINGNKIDQPTLH